MNTPVLLLFIIMLINGIFSNKELEFYKNANRHQNKNNGPQAEQIIVVSSIKNNSSNGILFGIEYIHNSWVVTFDSINCSIGKKGFANFNKKVEGDFKTPSGTFEIGSAFGYKNDLNCNMKFIELLDTHYWVNDVNSNNYNKLINFHPKVLNAEKMKRDDHLYKYGIIIEYNTKNAIKGKGSAIFIHVQRRKGSPTTGCVAISENDMKKLISWINPDKKPIILMGLHISKDFSKINDIQD